MLPDSEVLGYLGAQERTSPVPEVQKSLVSVLNGVRRHWLGRGIRLPPFLERPASVAFFVFFSTSRHQRTTNG